ncbi:uncharacterized protein VICG_00769 [Vittaforma corneae ATCC 50505]|uniref:Uncharacterized protein n=1 Tax=Vittaforma corneae (strain ATCC 50505) TaxID=993615 RepID=L2GML8_VITCO|nr:uncharacterized protein VICG_00769 [Vittaforma corneae ATCC 50505]ELA42128.1 hypothetical protein VICG_00769 [Vittaforma corneae ATCC 50505]
MPTLSQNEASFIANAIKSATRMDMRKMDEKRNQTMEESSKYASALADGTVQVTRGYSQISLSVTFRSSLRTLMSLNLALDTEGMDSNEFKTLKCTLSETNPSFKKIEEFLNSF